LEDFINTAVFEALTLLRIWSYQDWVVVYCYFSYVLHHLYSLLNYLFERLQAPFYTLDNFWNQLGSLTNFITSFFNRIWKLIITLIYLILVPLMLQPLDWHIFFVIQCLVVNKLSLMMICIWIRNVLFCEILWFLYNL
jgi:hypothetical protein